MNHAFIKLWVWVGLISKGTFYKYLLLLMEEEEVLTGSMCLVQACMAALFQC